MLFDSFLSLLHAGVFLVYEKGMQCTVLANNSALSASEIEDSRMGCFTVYNGTQQTTWLNQFKSPVTTTNPQAAIQQEYTGPNGTELFFEDFTESHAIVHECKVVDKNGENQILLLGLYQTIGEL